MTGKGIPRREFISRSTCIAAGSSAALAGITDSAYGNTVLKSREFPDLRIKEIKIHVTKYGRLCRVITESGIEGNYPVRSGYWHSNKQTPDWLLQAKRQLIGKNALDHEQILSQYEPWNKRIGQSAYASQTDNILWDIIGKAAGLPVYKMLGACREKQLAYASTFKMQPGQRRNFGGNWLDDPVEQYVVSAREWIAQGFKAIKIKPPDGPPFRTNMDGKPNVKIAIEICRAVREAVGDDYILMCDPVGVYNRSEALVLGRVLDELHFYAYEDPIPTSDIDGLAILCNALDVNIHIGEFIFSLYDYAPYIRNGALDVIRVIADNVGGISGVMRVGRLAECFGMDCEPHNYGDIWDHISQFHCELAMYNNEFIELMVPLEVGMKSEVPFIKTTMNLEKDGYVYAPTHPGLGIEIDVDKLDDVTTSIES